LTYNRPFGKVAFMDEAKSTELQEAKLTELKFHFEKTMEKYSQRNKGNIGTCWLKLIQVHDKPYHNLNLAYNDLKTANNLGFTIPFFVIIAAVLRYAQFDPTSNENGEKAVNYAKFVLDQAFGWTSENVQQVLDAIRASFRIVVAEHEPYSTRLIHDMKMARFARPTKNFLEDRENAQREFNHVSERKFLSSEETLLKCYKGLSNMYSLVGFRGLKTQANKNMYDREAYIREMIKWLDGTKKS